MRRVEALIPGTGNALGPVPRELAPELIEAATRAEALLEPCGAERAGKVLVSVILGLHCDPLPEYAVQIQADVLADIPASLIDLAAGRVMKGYRYTPRPPPPQLFEDAIAGEWHRIRRTEFWARRALSKMEDG